MVASDASPSQSRWSRWFSKTAEADQTAPPPPALRPVCMKVTAGSWLIGSEWIERTKHISSAHSPRLGHSSHISCPERPCFIDLIRIDDEVLAQGRQTTGETGLREVLGPALKKLYIREH